MSIKHEVRKTRKQTLEQLSALRDEARVQLHLLSMEAQERWSELETQIDALEARANRQGEAAAEELLDAIHQLSGVVREFLAQQVKNVRGLSTVVQTIMSAPARTCSITDSLNHAAHQMWDGDCGALPVLSNDDVVGIITDRDICMATYTQGRPPTDLRVDSAMSKCLYSCSPETSIGDALELMSAKRVRRLAVLGSMGELVGMVAFADIARWARSITNPSVDAALVEALASITTLAPHQLQPAAQ